MAGEPEEESMRKIFIGALACARNALLLLLLVVSSIYAGDRRYDVPVGDSLFLGPKDAPIIMIEFIDYQ
jgi:hypothetical protein